ncbi:hypothetical protein EXN00_16350 [Clostridium botulinum]|uniref:Uncharacterized protein n=1 Tax=Clostridium botulinum TaxID=1491 RepID=A0A6B3ZA30_CLOBO|nr:hypothetical protein RSJ14_08370 [Clostridium botulinum]MBN3367380.1 hypothetical protein [Clostridium botulinum]MBN3369303.1 hypothetical protein [Clostridium botulinum]MBN3375373.1 hypothetical protein [Clostridium botulinum]MBN3381597.1 hypothetical protein [Clostridium botulinum]
MYKYLKKGNIIVYFTERSRVKSSFCTSLPHRKFSLKIYTSFGLLKRGIRDVKGIGKSLEILICFFKIYLRKK